ncbi:MAG: arylamine N-acetyltransferase [Myxococcales bacterium]|nr:arylamine N-acetyltransferase [Myxococcales bacterium]
MLHHACAVPFENLDVLAGRGVSLEPDTVYDKLVVRRRGGYCFEHATLLAEMLGRLGFTLDVVAGRARVSRPRPEPATRTHAMLVVHLDGEDLLVDAALGARGATAALRFSADRQLTPHDVRRVLREDGVWFHQVEQAGVWVDASETRLEPMPPIDMEVASWYTSTHPDSGFRRQRMVARALPDGGRVTLADEVLTERHADGTVIRQELGTPEALAGALREHFGLEAG